MQDQELITVEELMTFLKISRPTAYRYVADGKFTVYKVGRNLRISKKSVDQFLNQNKL